MAKIAGSGSESRSASISQRHGFADPDPHQYVKDLEHWYFHTLQATIKNAVRGLFEEN
jgi:hypothetical protein